MAAWFHAIAESEHDIQNPSTPEKIRLLGERLRLGPTSHVLDVASGRAGPAIVLARAFGCRMTCVEQAEEFHAAATTRIREAGVAGLVELVHADAASFPLEPERYDAAICLGASFVWNDLPGTLAALAPSVRPRGFVAVGEPYWRIWPLPDGREDPYEGDYVTLESTVGRFEDAGLEPVSVVDASLDEWDRYVTLQWLVVEEWLAAHPDDAEAADIRAELQQGRASYLAWERELVGWAIVVGRKP